MLPRRHGRFRLCVLFLALWGLQRYVPAWLPVRRGMLALPLLWPGIAVADGSDTPEPDAALPAPAAPAAPAAPGPTVLQLRFNGTEVEKLPSGFIPGWGPDDLYYPRWMEGRWRVEQTLEGYAAPMGKQFLANGRGEVADKVLAEQQSQLGQAVSFELRYIRTQRNNIVEDRAFNTRAKLNAFAGREVVKSVEYVEVPDNTRESALQAGNSEADPLRTVVANFKGAVQKVFITALQFETAADGNLWRGLASTRTLFAAPGAGYNPLTVDEEVVSSLRKTEQGVKGRLRLLGYLNPNDQLFFKAGNRAVSIADYSLKYTRLD